MRVTGAQLLVSLGLEPSVVGLFGRWSSASVWRYIRETPIEASSSWMKASSSDSLENLVEQAVKAFSVRQTTSESQSVPMWAKIEELEMAIRDLRANLVRSTENTGEAASARDPSMEVVINTVSGVRHSIRQGAVEIDSGEWRAKCGWSFGRSGARRASSRGDSARWCEKCFPGEAAKAVLARVSATRVGE
eukprot:1555829-Amphidinium_carterae.1